MHHANKKREQRCALVDLECPPRFQARGERWHSRRSVLADLPSRGLLGFSPHTPRQTAWALLSLAVAVLAQASAGSPSAAATRGSQGSVGFVADNVINFKAVLTSGDIVSANKDTNKDLFIALKGGNNNFGAVTRFDVATFQNSLQINGGLIIVPVDSTDAVLESLQHFTDDSTGVHFNAGLTIEYTLNTMAGASQILLWVIDTDAAGDHAALKPFLEMQPQLVNRVATSSIAQYPSSVPPITRVMMADLTFPNDLKTLKGVHKITM
ncbi:prosolanapyrone-II oxidase [Microdochium nivale]|nr:prosolanapyrone-II oxidase [Microdochium nivale]